MFTNLPATVSRMIWMLILTSLITAITAFLVGHHIRDLWRLNTGYIFLNQGLADSDPVSLSNAEQTLERIGGQSPHNWPARRGMGLAYMIRGQLTAAMAQWSDYEGAVYESRAWAERAERLSDWITAEQWHRLSVKIDPDNGDHWYRLAQVSHQSGRNDEAIERYLIALNSPTRIDIGRSTILVRLAEAAKRVEQRDWSEVQGWYDRALKQDEFTEEREVFQARLGRAEALDHLRQYIAALEDYRWVADHQPGNYWANLHTGRLIWQIERDGAAAEEYLLNAIHINDSEKWAYRELGVIYAYAGRIKEAIEMFQQVLAIDPEDPIAKNRIQQLIKSNES
jgi:tetratricopeptide (TPR) repeat protein